MTILLSIIAVLATLAVIAVGYALFSAVNTDNDDEC